MTYIKLTNDMQLIVTQEGTIYRGDNMGQAITFLVPLRVSEIDIGTATIFLNYIRPDGSPEVVILERDSDMYDPYHYQFILPVTCKMSRYPGVICMWLQIMDGETENPAIKKSGECTIRIRESKSMDEYLCDHQLLALYQLKKKVDSLSGDDTGSSGDGSDDSFENITSEGFVAVEF